MLISENIRDFLLEEWTVMKEKSEASDLKEMLEVPAGDLLLKMDNTDHTTSR